MPRGWQDDSLARMTSKHPQFLLFAVLIALAGCAPAASFLRSAERVPESERLDIAAQRPDSATPRPTPRASGGPLGSAGLRPEQLDQTSPAERAAALAPSGAQGQLLGQTLASLGSPADPGIWLRTGLVTQVGQGRVEVIGGGGELRVELRPSGSAPGGGSQLSLAAFSALGIPLTQLIELRVFAQ